LSIPWSRTQVQCAISTKMCLELVTFFNSNLAHIVSGDTHSKTIAPFRNL
jgi:hypothetical protein